MIQQPAAHVLGELATDHLTHVGWHWSHLKAAVGAVRNDQTVVRADCHTLQPVPVSLEWCIVRRLVKHVGSGRLRRRSRRPTAGKAASERLAPQTKNLARLRLR